MGVGDVGVSGVGSHTTALCASVRATGGVRAPHCHRTPTRIPKGRWRDTHGTGLLVLTPTLGACGLGQVRGPDLTPVVRQGALSLRTLATAV